MNKALTPAQRAKFDQALEEAVNLTMDIVVDYDGLDPVDATRTMFQELMKLKAWSRQELAMATAALAVRLHRRESQ